MATYTELYGLKNDTSLLNRVTVAVAVKAQTILDNSASTAAAVTWANTALQSPRSVADQIFFYVLAANSAASVAQIQGAADAAIQSNVDAAVDAIIAGGV